MIGALRVNLPEKVVIGLLIIATVDVAVWLLPALTTTTGAPDGVVNWLGFGRILVLVPPGRLWVIILMPVISM